MYLATGDILAMCILFIVTSITLFMMIFRLRRYEKLIRELTFQLISTEQQVSDLKERVKWVNQ